MSGIPLCRQRAAFRLLLLAKISAYPSPATFRGAEVNCLLTDPAKARAMKIAGFDPGFTAEAYIVLAVTAAAPEPEKETIEVTDFSGSPAQLYDIAASTPLLGTGCFKLSLRARKRKAA